jgi:hypothetical protein
MDFGNAPDTYATTLANDGARHTVSAGIMLGRSVYAESNGQPNGTPADNDGVVFASLLTPGDTATIQVTASVDGYLNAWMDFGRDGTFSAAGDQIFTDTHLSAGTTTLTFRVPATASTGETWTRFRFNRRGLLSWKGLATDGEVEDYKVTITSIALQPQSSSNRGAGKWFQPPQPTTSTSFVFQNWSERSGTTFSQIVADDWQCQSTLPVTGFQWWGSFAGWTQSRIPAQTPTAFQLSIWTNSPATTAKGSFAHPSTLVWQATCTNWVWNVAGQVLDPRNINSAETCFEFTCLLSQDQWFYQDDSKGTTTYWLSIAAVYDSQQTPTYPWGWMTGPASSNNGAVAVTAAASSTGSAVWPPSLTSVWAGGSQIVNTKAAIQHMAFNILTNEGDTISSQDLSPVYRFWSASLSTHFYTINEAEKQKLLEKYADIWFYEGVAFYAFQSGSQPTSALPVYRFRSASDGHQFYTISESEKTKLIQTVPSHWVYEGVMWYAYSQI